MAIDNYLFSKNESEWGISEEATFGTAIADTGNFEKWEGEIPSVSDYGVTRYQNVLNGNGRVPHDANFYASQVGGTRIIPFSNTKVRRKDLAVMLYSVLQVMDEGETPTFTKVMTIDNTVTQPLFSNNAGYFFTFGIKDVIASYHYKFTSCIIKSLTLSSTLYGGDGLLMASGEIISGFAANTTANFNTGTWALNTKNYINFGQPTTKQIASVDVLLYGFDITFNNNAVRVGNNSSGNAESYALAMNDQGYSITGNLKVKYDANVQSMIANDLAGTGVKIQLATGTPAATGHVDFTMNECFCTATPTKEYDTEAGQMLNIPFVAAYDASGTTALFTGTISDAEDRAWPT